MGVPVFRLNRITPPSGDDVAWLPTTIVMAPVKTAEYGLAPGHWKQTAKDKDTH